MISDGNAHHGMEENSLKNLNKVRKQIGSVSVGALLFLLTLIAPNAEAKKRPKQPLPTDVQILGRIGLNGVRGVKMFVHEQQGRWYLYAGHASEQGFTIVDVTDPTDPKVVKSVSSQDQGSYGTLEQIGNVTFATTEGKSTDDSEDQKKTMAEKFNVWDLADPLNPTLIRQFSGVSSVLVDERKCIYVMDSEGLWILRKTQPNLPFPYGPNDPYPNGQDLYHG
jgi:hypothetical protein